MRKVIFTTLLLVLCSCNSDTQSQEYEINEFFTDLVVPWEIYWGADDHLWVTERPGRVNRINPETKEKQLLLDITGEVDTGSEKGLMGLTLHPDFSTNGYVYIAYNFNGENGDEVKVERYTFEEGKLINPELIIDGIVGNWNHDGCRLAFGPDGKLYISTGEAGNTSLSQNLSSLNGKILRVNEDGSIPADNPYKEVDGLAEEVWSWGHRNPQGMVFHNGILYSSEHGPGSNDELNIIEKARNYGWPDVKGYCNQPDEMDFCNEHNIREPIAIFYETYTLAVAGIDYYDVQDGEPHRISDWQNSIFMATLAGKKLVRIPISDNGMEAMEEEFIIDDEYGRLRDVCVAPDGRIFVAVSNRDGRGQPASSDDRILVIEKEGPNTVQPNDSGELINISPNPVDENFRIESKMNKIAELKIFDAIGNLIMKFTLQPNESQTIEEKLTSGTYYISGSAKEEKISKKFVVAW